MTDLTNVWPSWGENGELPPIGFFYEGGDRVNEKHLDALWNNLNVEWNEIISGITNRTKDIEGNTVLDTGLVASAGAGTDVNVTASTAGAYVDGQRTGSVASDTVSLSSNSGGGSTRTDTIQVSKDGIISANENSTSPSGTQMKLAEVDVSTSDTITAVRRHTNRNLELFAQDEQPANPTSGAGLWSDTDADITKVWNGSVWEGLATRSWATSNFVDVTGDTMTGTLTLSDASPAASQAYVDSNAISQSDADLRYINESGDTMDGTLTLSDASPAASQAYVDGQVPSFASEQNTVRFNHSSDANGSRTKRIDLANEYNPDAFIASAGGHILSADHGQEDEFGGVRIISYNINGFGNVDGFTIEYMVDYIYDIDVGWTVMGVLA